MLSTSHNFLFIHVPKTGGNSIQSVLSTYADDKITCVQPWQDGVERFEVRSEKHSTHKHSTAAEYRQAYGEYLYSQLFKFCTVRNPWDRCISHYFSPHRGKVEWSREAFIQFVQAEVMPLEHYAAVDEMGFVIRFESIQSDFDTVCRSLSIPLVSLPHRNASRRLYYRSYFDTETAEIVRAKFAEEVRHFGYAF